MENQIEEITQFLPIYVVLLSNSKLLSPVFGEVRSSKFEVQACRSSEVSRLGFQFLGRFGVQISVSKYHWFEKFEVRSYRSLECCSRFGFRFLRRFGFLLCQTNKSVLLSKIYSLAHTSGRTHHSFLPICVGSAPVFRHFP